MTIQACIEKIDRFLKRENVEPMIVNVNNRADLEALVTHYNVGANRIICAADLCKKDAIPQMDKVSDCICNTPGTVLVRDLTPFLLLEGEKSTQDTLRGWLSLSTKGHVVLLAFQCKSILTDILDRNPRLEQRLCLVDGIATPLPKLVFVGNKFGVPAQNTSEGIERLAERITVGSEKDIYISTSKTKSSFPHSFYSIRELRSAYSALAQIDPLTDSLKEEFGDEEKWQIAFERVKERNGWFNLITAEFGNTNALNFSIATYKSFSPDKQWLYFIALKLYGAKYSPYLARAAELSDSTADMVWHLYRDIMDESPFDSEFDSLYNERKQILLSLGNPVDQLVRFCSILPSEEKTALYYLTDSTQKETELIFLLLDRYGSDYEREELLQILKHVYPALYAYLQPFQFRNELLDSYFQEYKYQKVINKVFPEFERLVESQAQERSYNSILQPRSSIIESIQATQAQVYFVDAMGVEYLGFIMEKCHELGLMANVTVCRSELPTISCRNKNLVLHFEAQGVPVISIKDLDEIKHHGKDSFDYEKTKLPIHLAKELEILDELLQRIKGNIVGNNYKKAILIADHGASRLAVIHETDSMCAMASSGVHSGRCCPKSDLDVQPDFAADAEDFWALANYDRFIGGRKANVEVHGGATLEEVVVPIIEISYLTGRIEASIIPVDGPAVGAVPRITVSFRKKAAVKVFLTQNLQNVSIGINNVVYPAIPNGEGFYYVEMPDLKKAGLYSVDIFACGNKVATGLQLEIAKESGGVKDIL